jgi:hypothetical protein
MVVIVMEEEDIVVPGIQVIDAIPAMVIEEDLTTDGDITNG